MSDWIILSRDSYIDLDSFYYFRTQEPDDKGYVLAGFVRSGGDNNHVKFGPQSAAIISNELKIRRMRRKCELAGIDLTNGPPEVDQGDSK